MSGFTISRRIAAPPDVVFATITDHRAYPEFTPIRRAVLELEGEGAPNGVGAIRALHVLGPPIREEVVAYEPPRRFAYRVLSGLPVRSQAGTVTIEPDRDDAGRSVMSYEIEFEPPAPVPFGGSAIAAGMRLAIGRLMAGVAAEAERRARSGAQRDA